MRELLHALRRLRLNPMFTIAATVTLALTIGATASVFSVVDVVVLKAFPFREPDRVLAIRESSADLRLPWFAVAAWTFLDWRVQARSLSTLAAWDEDYAMVTGSGEPERVQVLRVTPSYFPTLGMTAVLGRGLATDSGGPAEVVISYASWQTRFGGTRSVLGKVLTIDDHPYSIVGVVPNGWPGDARLWTHLSLTAQDERGGGHHLIVYGRLRRGVTADAGRRELDAILSRDAGKAPAADTGWSVVTLPGATPSAGAWPLARTA